MKHSKKGGNKTAQPLNLTPGGKVNVPRNSFDMSYHTLFTSPAGMLLPNYVQDVNYGDYLRLDASNFTRTMPVNTAAFCRFKEVTDFYFVPYRLLWRWYDTFITNVDDVQTSYYPADSRTGNGKIPVIKASDIVDKLLNPDENIKDMFSFNNAYNFERLLDLLGYPVSNDGQFDETRLIYTKLDKTEFNPFRLLAYQLLYNNYYRNTDFETNQPDSFNIDHLANGAIIDFKRKNLRDMAKVRYVQWRKDRLTSIKPSPLSLLNVGFQPKSIDGFSSYSSFDNKLNTTIYKPSFSGDGISISAQALRGAMALDRVARLTMLTPKKYDDQIKARYGVNIPNCDYCEARYLGTFDSSLNIGEVTATASGSDGSSTNVLGELAGKGISAGSTNRPITAKFDEAGIVMGIHYILPNAEYDSSRTDDFNRKLLRNDYYMPEYDDLGLQPLQGYSVPQNTSPNGLVQQTTVIGYQSRYSEYKSRVDEIHGLFQSKAPLSFWTTARNASNISSGIWSSIDLHVNPKITDSIFALKYDGKQTSDPFLCHFKFNATLVRNMSVIGVPQL